jgi:hypothetical protein
MANAREQHTATLLPNGTVLVAGGSNGTASQSSAEIYDSVANLWSITGSMSNARSRHSAVLLSKWSSPCDKWRLLRGDFRTLLVTPAQGWPRARLVWIRALPNWPFALTRIGVYREIDEFFSATSFLAKRCLDLLLSQRCSRALQCS